MKAVVFRKGRGLVVEDVPVPRLEPDQLLIQVANAGFCGSDHTLVEMGILPDGYILGHEFSGTVVELGADVSDTWRGRRVIVRPTYCGACPQCAAGRPQFCRANRRTTGIGDLPGGFAEHVKAFAGMPVPVPPGVDSRNAALAEMFAAALHGIHASGARSGSALVLGGGPIGLATVRLLKLLGFGPVALSEPIRRKRDLALLLGADSAIDPFSEEMAPRVQTITHGAGFETVFECSGVPGNIQAGMEAAAIGGTVCEMGIHFGDAVIQPRLLNFKEVRLTGAYGNSHRENIQCLQWMAEGKLDGAPIISDLIALDDLPRIYRERIHPGKAVKVLCRVGEEF
jgi:(R,R)-butanediol dehydrogenase/meso-butanediol dehydrogenase/diacetyl reductase